jgi:hypothetical protein
MHCLARLNPANFLLAHPEFQFEGVGAPQGE